MTGEHKLQGITIKRRNSKNGYTTPCEIYGKHKVIKTLSDPGHWEKKCWITMYNKKFLLTDYGANDESTLEMGVKQPCPMNHALRNQNVQECSII